MPEYLVPGVYVEEPSNPPQAIEGVDTNTTGFLGETERGPLQATLVSSYSEFQRHFGGDANPGAYLPSAVRGFFDNGGRRAFICRILSRSATVAEAAFGPHYRVQAAGPGRWGNRIFARIDDASDSPDGFRVGASFDAEGPFDDASDLVRLVRAEDAPPDATPERGLAQLTGGDDGAAIDVEDFKGDGASGLAGLSSSDCANVSLVCAPGCAADVASALIDHCEAMRYRIAVLDAPSDMSADYDPREAIKASSYAALYAPWLLVPDPCDPAKQRKVPPSGHVAGVFARTDNNRGVWKAPANETLNGVADVAMAIDKAQQDSLHPRSVNVIRSFHQEGIRVWGSRTLSSDSGWKYVNVRRLMIYIEHSIDLGTQWAVFEPNEEPLWQKVAEVANRFLLKLWRDGALLGSKPEQAFFVKCDRTTMTQADIDAGHLICLIGVAPVKPAEFVIVRIGHCLATSAQPSP